MQTAIVGIGCFWKETEFKKLKGVISTEVGYCGGNTNKTDYKKVCSGNCNSAEVVKVNFDEKILSYENFLRFFFSIHDPTTLNSQGPDIGRQYRSVIYYLNDFQKERALKSKEKFQPIFKNRIVTEITKADIFYKAEEYHQQYIQKRVSVD